MNIKSFLAPEHVLLDVKTSDKAQLLRKLAERAAGSVSVTADRIFNALTAREGLGSTGTGQGIAIPHARFAELKKPFGILARLKRSIAFDAIDDQPVDIVFLLLLPDSSAGEQLSALASVARRLRNADTIRDLRGAKDSAGAFQAMTAEAGAATGQSPFS